jgi:hypothetical protein
MSNQESLSELFCAISLSDQHFLKDPITLINCGHSICKDCLPNPPIKCGKCDKVTDRDLRNDKVSIIAKQMIKMNLSRMYKEIEKLTSENIDNVKSMNFCFIFIR